MTKKTKKVLLIGGLVAAAATGGYFYWKSKQSAAPSPSQLPTGDVYNSLSSADQAALRNQLFGSISQSACSSVDLSGVTSADSLNDAGNRAAAVDCYQSINHVGSAAGVLDQATYSSIMKS